MPTYVRLGDSMPLPDVVELPLEDAKNVLENKGFDVIIADSVYDSHYAKGLVVEQMPFAYSEVKKGRNVYLTVSIGEKPIVMPNLFSKSPREAELILKNNGLELGSKYYEYSDLALEGVVINQSFPPGQTVKQGKEIDITISLGQMSQKQEFPNLVGQSLGVAKKKLEALGISNVEIEYREKENMLPETVLKQNIPAGAPLEIEKPVRLTVSKVGQIEGED